MKTKLAILLAVALLCGAALTAQAATITVTNLNDSGPGSLRQAIANAASGDTINFAVTGAIILTSGQLTIGTNLTISGPGQKSLTIDGNHSSRVLEITNGNVFISSLTVSNGNGAGLGGAIANSANLTVSNCCITASTAYSIGQSTGAGGIVNYYQGNLV